MTPPRSAPHCLWEAVTGRVMDMDLGPVMDQDPVMVPDPVLELDQDPVMVPDLDPAAALAMAVVTVRAAAQEEVEAVAGLDTDPDLDLEQGLDPDQGMGVGAGVEGEDVTRTRDAPYFRGSHLVSHRASPFINSRHALRRLALCPAFQYPKCHHRHCPRYHHYPNCHQRLRNCLHYHQYPNCHRHRHCPHYRRYPNFLSPVYHLYPHCHQFPSCHPAWSRRVSRRDPSLSHLASHQQYRLSHRRSTMNRPCASHHANRCRVCNPASHTACQTPMRT